MAHIKNSSVRKIEAARILINNGCHAESVHYSYYSVLLYMKYILNSLDEKARITYEKQKEDKSADSHNYILGEITTRVNNTKDKRYINEEFRTLKLERVSSDYDGKIFDSNKSTEPKQLSEGLISKLKNSFGNP